MRVIYLNVVNDQVVGIQALVLSIGFGVLEEVKQELGGLLGPTSLAGSVNLGLGVTADTSHEPPEGNDFLLLNHVLEVSDRTVEGHTLDSLGCLAGVLKLNA